MASKVSENYFFVNTKVKKKKKLIEQEQIFNELKGQDELRKLEHALSPIHPDLWSILTRLNIVIHMQR